MLIIWSLNIGRICKCTCVYIHGYSYSHAHRQIFHHLCKCSISSQFLTSFQLVHFHCFIRSNITSLYNDSALVNTKTLIPMWLKTAWYIIFTLFFLITFLWSVIIQIFLIEDENNLKLRTSKELVQHSVPIVVLKHLIPSRDGWNFVTRYVCILSPVLLYCSKNNV